MRNFILILLLFVFGCSKEKQEEQINPLLGEWHLYILVEYFDNAPKMTYIYDQGTSIDGTYLYAPRIETCRSTCPFLILKFDDNESLNLESYYPDENSFCFLEDESHEDYTKTGNNSYVISGFYDEDLQKEVSLPFTVHADTLKFNTTESDHDINRIRDINAFDRYGEILMFEGVTSVKSEAWFVKCK